MLIRTIIRLLLVGAALEAVPADAQTFPPLGAEEASRALTARALLFPDVVTFSRIPASTLRSGNVAVAPRLSAFTAGATPTTSLHGRQSFQRAFADFRQEQEEKDPVLKYVGVGMMVVGGINFLYGSVACADAGTGGRCVPYVVISGGIGVGGWFLYKRHR